MHIIKLNAIDSTQLFVKRYVQQHSHTIPDMAVWTKKQTAGVGQYGTNWQVEAGKNLTFSLLKNFDDISIDDYFVLNMLVSLAVVQTLEPLGVPQLKIKWPNDILSSNKKIGGILIENSVRNQSIFRSIIGIGLNVNQENYEGLPKASSLKNVTNQIFDVEKLLHSVLQSIENQFYRIKIETFETIYEAYRRYLYKTDEVSAFRPVSGTDFSGIIRGVTHSGTLLVEQDDGQLYDYKLKEIELLY